MHVHSIETIEELKRLRRLGYSINELVYKLGIPKTTVWHHINGLKISSRYVAMLNAKRGGNQKRKALRIEKAKEKAGALISGPHRDILIGLAMLYWSEGTKEKCDFINSDGTMIRIYLSILRKVLNIPEVMIVPTLRMFSGMNQGKCLNYWSKITNIPKHRFVVRFNDGGTKGRTMYGMCRISVKKGGNTLKLMRALIEQVSKEIITKLN